MYIYKKYTEYIFFTEKFLQPFIKTSLLMQKIEKISIEDYTRNIIP